jgi:hypothetical protein
MLDFLLLIIIDSLTSTLTAGSAKLQPNTHGTNNLSFQHRHGSRMMGYPSINRNRNITYILLTWTD